MAIPFFDVSEGELIDVEGLLQAIHPLTCGRERKMMDSVMSFFSDAAYDGFVSHDA